MKEKIKDISLLVAEDEKELLDYISEYLHLFFEKIYTATNGIDAYAIYKDKKHDIIITDINMPSLDGLSLISKIRQEEKETKIIIMSAHSEEEKLLQAVELHLETYLIKPINVEKLKEVLFRSVEELRKHIKRIYLDEEVYWDVLHEKLYRNKEEIALKTKERLCMRLLCENLSQPVSAEQIFYAVHKNGEDLRFSSNPVTSLVKRLRTKLPRGALKNVYGAGYMIREL
jgi:DNA-binding response OmpR family regulator